MRTREIVAQRFDQILYGKGTYFAVDFEYSAQDSHSWPNVAGDQ